MQLLITLEPTTETWPDGHNTGADELAGQYDPLGHTIALDAFAEQ
jgi:hypothetical protein